MDCVCVCGCELKYVRIEQGGFLWTLFFFLVSVYRKNREFICVRVYTVPSLIFFVVTRRVRFRFRVGPVVTGRIFVTARIFVTGRIFVTVRIFDAM